jgi:8-oxo-dGTP pyrophosphatase MutT (NUDIX family)
MKQIKFQGKYLTVTTEEKTIGGKSICFETASLPPSVHVIPLFENGDILLIDEKKGSDNQRKLRVMAGVQEKEDLTPLEAAKREVKEELGILHGDWEHFHTTTLQGIIQDSRVYYIIRNFTLDTPTPHEGEEIYGAKRVALSSLIPDILDGKWGSSPTPLVLLMLAKDLNLLKIKK